MKELSLNILDIVQNSIRAEADEITISIHESINDDIYQIVIADNGTGIPDEILKNVTDPFVTTRKKRRMGLGLPFLKFHAELTGGGLEIKSEEGKGTEVKASFSFKHIDRQPLGDIIGVLVILMAANQKVNFIYQHTTEKGQYRFSSKETMQYLEIDTLQNRLLLRELSVMISESLKEIEATGFESKESNEVSL
jgi:K+-sensing histidine kinase KdpD